MATPATTDEKKIAALEKDVATLKGDLHALALALVGKVGPTDKTDKVLEGICKHCK